MIDRESKLSIGRQARFLGISRGSVYYLPKPVSERDLDLMKRLDRLHLKTLMTGMGIEAVYCKPNTSKKTPGREIYPYLPHGMTINRANRVRALDTTYIPMVKGFVYLTAVVDWASRKVLAAKGFVDAVKNQGCQLSMVGRGAWRDNVFVERLWRSVKYERVYLHAYDSVGQARASILGYFEWYHHKRPHSSLNRKKPHQAYTDLLPGKMAA